MEDTNPPAADPAGGGTCTTMPCTPAKYEATLSTPEAPTIPDWTQVQVTWAMFTPGVSGTTSVPVTGDRITGLNFNVGLTFAADPNWVDPDPNTDTDQPTYIGVPAPIDLKIDDITFMQ
jgi:hypothetical protein